MASLPNVGGDNNAWGGELNTWLLVQHNADGTHSISALIPIPIPPVDGGTGVASPSAHGIAVAEGVSNFNFVLPSAGSYSIVSQGVAADPVYTNVQDSLSLNTPLSVGSGGLGISSAAAHGIPIATGGGSFRITTPSTQAYAFKSDGAGFDPNFGILAAGGGGTGQSVMPVNAVMLGNADKPVIFALPKQVGFVLTDNGPGQPPSMQALPAASVAIPQFQTAVGVGSGLTGVAPSTASYSYVSQGASSNPAFSQTIQSLVLTNPLPVNSGGIGITSVASDSLLAGTGGGSLKAVSVINPAQGGTGASSLTDHSIVVSHGSSALTALTNTLSTLNYAVVGQGPANDPTFSNVQGSLSLSTPLPVGSGGIGLNAVAANNLLVGSGGGSLRAISIINPAQGGTGVSSLTDHSILIAHGSSAITALTNTLGTLNYGVVGQGPASDPIFSNLQNNLQLTIPLAVNSGGTGLSVVPANSVLIGEGGGQLNIALISTQSYSFKTDGNVAPNFGIVSPTGGGTGQSLIVDYSILAGNGGSPNQPLGLITPNTLGFVLTDNGPGAIPTFSTPPKGRLTGIKVLTNGTVYVPTAGTTSFLVEGVGGGGAGGGCASTGASQSAMGSGGQAGGYFKKYYAAPLTKTSYTYAIGVRGFARLGANPGAAGGNTTFDTCTANGGNGGTGGSAITPPGFLQGGNGSGGSSGGDFNISSGDGGTAVSLGSAAVLGGFGGASMFSFGGRGSQSNGNGTSAAGFGGGGGGGANVASAGAIRKGGEGSDGAIIIYEYA